MTTGCSPLSATDTLPQDWKYVSEGGATIVFSYTGDPQANPHFNGTVLRLRKTLRSHSNTARASSPNVATEYLNHSQVDLQDDSDDAIMEFQKTIMERLIPPEYLPRLTSVHVDYTWLEGLANLRDSDRPHDRRQHDHIDFLRTKAVLATDLVGDYALAVEIKASGCNGSYDPVQSSHHLTLAKMGFSSFSDTSLARNPSD